MSPDEAITIARRLLHDASVSLVEQERDALEKLIAVAEDALREKRADEPTQRIGR